MASLTKNDSDRKSKHLHYTLSPIAYQMFNIHYHYCGVINYLNKEQLIKPLKII